MKKLLIFAAVCISMTAQATIFRVSNLTNSGAPYSSISDAMSAAMDGDTIMVDGSTTSYGPLTITKRLVIMGPGYLLSENGVSTEGTPSAQVSTISSDDSGAAGSVIIGIESNGEVSLLQPNMILTRCRFTSSLGIKIGTSATNCVIHQNFIANGQVKCSVSGSYAPGTQITNNILGYSGSNSEPVISYLTEGYIAYNTFVYPDRKDFASLTGCTVENNVCVGNQITISGNTMQNNYWPGMRNSSGITLYSDRTTDLTIKNQELSEEIAAAIADKGAFHGDDPYVISGVPAGPMIQDITVPASVQQGSSLNVTIKLGIQR